MTWVKYQKPSHQWYQSLTFILIDSLGYGIPYPQLIYHYLPVIKTILYTFLWNHFLLNFQSNNPCTFHFVRPYCNCINSPLTPAYK